jgi:hypothetical protein
MAKEKPKDKCFTCGKPATQYISIDYTMKKIPLCDRDECYFDFMAKVLARLKK